MCIMLWINTEVNCHPSYPSHDLVIASQYIMRVSCGGYRLPGFLRNELVPEIGWNRMLITRTMKMLSSSTWHIAPGLVSTWDKTSYRKSRSRKIFIQNCAVTLKLYRPLSNFKAMRKWKLPISRLRDFKISYNKTSYRILKRNPGSH